ncbi:MAG: glycosyltransferase family 4 protein [Rickettsiales bacterium]|nr:glycosyltransferase family 4 protein [Rickettsiales bacterium]
MKIVNIILTSQNGGAEQVFIDYLAILKNLGHEVLAVVKNDAPYANEVTNLGIVCKKIENNFGDYDIFAVKNLQKILQEFNAQAVIAHVGRSMILIKKAIKKITKNKIFLIAVNHSNNVKRSIGADLIFSVNREIFYRTFDYGQAEDKTFVIPNAVDLSDAIAEMPLLNLQKKDTIILGAMARIDNKKGFDYLIKAIARLEKLAQEKNLSQKFILKIAGSGAFEKDLRALTTKLNLNDKIEFCGWVKNKKEFFQSIDIFCSASDNETFGLVLLEAIKYRKPIIATATDGSKEILRHEVDGLILAPDSKEKLDQLFADKVLQLIENPQLLNFLLEQSFIRLNTKFSYQALENKLKEIFGVGL